jgi:hypothetical protein
MPLGTSQIKKERRIMMKTLTLALIGAALLAAQDQPAKKTPPAKPASSKKAASQRISIPPQAVQVGPNAYRYVDEKGKVWMYSQTPFGISKWEDTRSAQPPAADANRTSVTDLGDSVRFERITPFGTTRTIRKKTELSNEEKALLEREQNQNRPPAPEAAAETPQATAEKPQATSEKR